MRFLLMSALLGAYFAVSGMRWGEIVLLLAALGAAADWLESLHKATNRRLDSLVAAAEEPGDDSATKRTTP